MVVILQKTATKAVVQMEKNQKLDSGFQLQIGLAEIHVPRMWVEEDPDCPDHHVIIYFTLSNDLINVHCIPMNICCKFSFHINLAFFSWQ